MNPEPSSKLLRIGVFYDGNFFVHVSNYYKYAHKRKCRISIPGLHDFIRHLTSEKEGVDARFCQIVDAHFFRGRFSARAAEDRQQLYNDRVFDDILMGEGIVTHFLPMRGTGEKGIDVWLALEAFELAVYKRFDVLVLIAGDGDFVPLARKVNSLGTRVMVLGWDFAVTDEQGRERNTTTSIHLLDEVTYPILMHNIIDDKTRRDDPQIKNLFVEPKPPQATTPAVTRVTVETPTETVVVAQPQADPQAPTERFEGTIERIKEGFGFIRSTAFQNNIFFYWDQLRNRDFNDLQVGNRVTFSEGANAKGVAAIEIDVT